MQNYLKSFSPKGKETAINEISFAKQFLTSLDQKPTKLSADHVEDARKLPAQPAYILPKHPTPMPPPGTTSRQSPPTQPTLLTAHLKSLRPATTTSLLNLPPTTSIHSLKSLYANQHPSSSSLDTSKIKILFNKKPVADSKTLGDVVGEDGSREVEFSVMVVGAGTTPKTVERDDPMDAVPTAEGKRAGRGEGVKEGGGEEMDWKAEGGEEEEVKRVLEGEEFWRDLRGWLEGKLKSGREAERLAGVWREAVKR
ncbi:MAG: hypothetical protein M1820_005441 [Bogoriella megaspora]|nr:MAG: hypothetical protein M1820_005441 [Bogoriella megaspora]